MDKNIIERFQSILFSKDASRAMRTSRQQVYSMRKRFTSGSMSRRTMQKWLIKIYANTVEELVG